MAPRGRCLSVAACGDRSLVGFLACPPFLWSSGSLAHVFFLLAAAAFARCESCLLGTRSVSRACRLLLCGCRRRWRAPRRWLTFGPSSRSSPAGRLRPSTIFLIARGIRSTANVVEFARRSPSFLGLPWYVGTGSPRLRRWSKAFRDAEWMSRFASLRTRRVLGVWARRGPPDTFQLYDLEAQTLGGTPVADLPPLTDAVARTAARWLVLRVLTTLDGEAGGGSAVLTRSGSGYRVRRKLARRPEWQGQPVRMCGRVQRVLVGPRAGFDGLAHGTPCRHSRHGR